MTSKKRQRRYGDLSARPLPTESAGLIDDVFAAFTGAKPAEAEPPPTTVEPVPAATPPSTPPSPRQKRDVSPRRDFQKVANSITREAIPAGMFTGKAKLLYDCLYSLTRGAVVPKMAVRIPRSELMKKSGIGAKVTLEQNLRRLIAAGLVKYQTIGGIQGGNEYTVYLPEEVTPPSTPPSTGTRTPSGGEKLGVLAPLETSPPSHGVSVDSQRTSDAPKTSFKTNTENDDDEAFAPLLAAAREVVGKEAAPGQWRELAEVLAAELKLAASRTTVSSAPAFLAEHLRRRLWKKDKAQLEEGKGETPQPAARLDISKCPSCFGTGMHYPDGFEKGVARCRHERLMSDR